MDFKVINQASLPYVDGLVHEVDPKAQSSGREWSFLNPNRTDAERGSASINRDSGVWKDFSSGEGGSDVVSWWAFCRNLSMGAAGKELAQRFGVDASGAPAKPWKGPKPGLEFVPMFEAPELPYVAPRGASMIWTYQDEEGRPLYQRPRFEPKNEGEKKKVLWWCIFRAPDGTLGWKNNAPPVPRPLYGLPDLHNPNRDRNLIVEGEKTADAAHGLLPRFAVLTSGGADSAGTTSWAPLKGREDVTLWPDHDPAGLEYAGAVAAQLKPMGIRLRVVDVPASWPAKWDLADPLPEGVTPADVQRMIDKAPFWDGHEEVSPAKVRLIDFVISAQDLSDLVLPPRELIVDPFIPAQGISMVYGGRGIGKTWFNLELARAVTTGTPFYKWHVPLARRVLYLDGEMPKKTLQDRADYIYGIRPSGWPLKGKPAAMDLLDILPSEDLWLNGVPLRINQVEGQERVYELLRELEAAGRRPDLLILDNLSSLASGAEENSNDDQDAILAFLMSLRHMGFSVLLVHHAGKGGDQRGASRREDPMDTSIRLTGEEGQEGAAFKIEFTKERGEKAKPSFLSVRLERDDNGGAKWTYGHNLPAYLESLVVIRDEQPVNATALSKIQDVTPQAARKQVGKLREMGLLAPKGMIITGKGHKALDRLENGDAA